MELVIVIVLAIAAYTIYKSFSSRNQPREITWDHKKFVIGGKIYTSKYAGHGEVVTNNIRRDVNFGPGQYGIFTGQEMFKNNRWSARVRWDNQYWTDWATGQRILIPTFDGTIHPDYIEPVDSKEKEDSLSLLLRNEVTWEDSVFRAGDRVKLKDTTVAVPASISGHSREIRMGPDQTGTMLHKVPIENNQWLAHIKWDDQEWREYDSLSKVKLASFESSIHPGNLEHIKTR